MTSRNSKFPEQNKTIDLLNLLKTNDTRTKVSKAKEKNKKETTLKKEVIKYEEPETPVEPIKEKVQPVAKHIVVEEVEIIKVPSVENVSTVKEIIEQETIQLEVPVTEEPLVPSRNTVYFRLTGRLGNNLFQIAAARFYASQHSMDVKFFFTDAYQKDKDTFEKTGLQTILKKPIEIITEEQLISDINEYHTANEQSSIIYQEIPFEENKDLILMGDRQSEKYFNKDFASDLLNLDDISKEVKRLYGNLANTCAIHINRKNNALSESEVRAIRQKFPDDDFIIFSDDIEWCKYRFSDLNFRFADKTSNSYSTALIDMVAMSKCMCVVMSNSTFSWWSAYLSKRPGHITVYKNPWFTDSQKEDIIPDDNSWITLEQFLSL
jgi:hypothetical protein